MKTTSGTNRQQIANPAFRPSPGSVDCHAHLFGPASRYPYAADRSYTPVEANAESYARMLDSLGIDRAVLVQGSAHGTDNRILLDAIAAYRGRFLGIAVVDPAIGDAELKVLDDGGIRGLRLSDTLMPATPLRHMTLLARRVERLGWHLQLHVGRCEDLIGLAEAIRSAPVPILVDHMASVTADEGVHAAGFRMLLELLTAHDHVWTKIAAFYRRSSSGPPYSDMSPMARAVVDARPERVVWGTNWPHPVHDGDVPNDRELLDIFAAWFPEPSLRETILVRNPQQLFGFPVLGR